MSGTDHIVADRPADPSPDGASLAGRAKTSRTALLSWLDLSRLANPPSGPVDPAFLPAALEILEKPPSPTGRTIIWLIVSAAALALTWACLAQVDEVAVAPGRIIPRSRLQTVEPAETGVVRAILVHEGERVAAGQPLVELDPTFADADAQSARTEFATAQLARARADALLAQASGRGGALVAPDGADAAALGAEREAVRARVAALRERISGIEGRIAGARAEIAGAEAEKSSLEQTLPLVQEQLAARRSLLEKGLMPRPQVAALEERVVDIRGQIGVKTADIARAEAEIATLSRERGQALADFRAQAAAEKAEAESIVATRQEGVRKAEQRGRYQALLSPVAGIVQEISVTSLGEVAEAGKPLVTVVPAGDELIVEALVLNKDAGFVRAGQHAIIKLDAYPFARYGYLEGVVESVSPDAVTDEQRGLVFPTRVRLESSQLRMATSYPPAIPSHVTVGMSVQGEIVTGRRFVVDYFLSPISRSMSEAGRER